MKRFLIRAAVAVALTAGPFAAFAQEAGTMAARTETNGMVGTVEQVSNHVGEMDVEVTSGTFEVDDVLRFEPYQQIEEMFLRDDVVYLMRHGPTDWSKLDRKDVAPSDCANQRVLSERGAEDMRNFGTLLAANDVLPSRVIVSQWCRNQQTLEYLLEGIGRVAPGAAADLPVRTDADLNLLLSLQGAKNTGALGRFISEWDGDPEREGPLLMISHYTNIEELTQFRVFEGEILVLDPKRDNQVLGYIRLRSAEPDVGHFSDALASPLLDEAAALDMVDRYYQALSENDVEMLTNVLSDRWVLHGGTASEPVQNVDDFLARIARYTSALADVRFETDDVHLADDVITVRGTIRGRHVGTLMDVPATGRDVAFGVMAVHRIEEGEIVESWEMADRASLMRQISGDE
ncbi:ester cyclase [uncultured Jannaschia sp.]|uniref:ester cyclase n=1 Tax=uncultured Jannaschia sp. TaxID=293347 RepID=UPI002629D23B|nr:ester cyclase [uncultured Jannaschia sp.]